MSADKGIDRNITEGNVISVNEDKLNAEQKAELDSTIEALKPECLKSYNASRTREFIKKFDFPSPQPMTKSQHDNMMIDMKYQAVGHAFINKANVMTNSFQNAMVKAMQEGTSMKFSGLCYQQPIASVADAATPQMQESNRLLSRSHWKLYPRKLSCSLRHHC